MDSGITEDPALIHLNKRDEAVFSAWGSQICKISFKIPSFSYFFSTSFHASFMTLFCIKYSPFSQIRYALPSFILYVKVVL